MYNNSQLFNKKRKLISIYINAICNLNCQYCYINKNHKLKLVDNMIEESLKTDYYINTIKEIFTDHNVPEIFEIWGGEPLLSIDRVIDTYVNLLKEYPNLNVFTTSSNFSHDNVIPALIKLLNIYKGFPNRNFKVKIQISIDGMKDMTDESRGIGVTEKIINNFNQLVKILPDIVPQNVIITFHTKQTLSQKNLYKMESKDYVINHFQFLENNFIEPIKNLQRDNIKILETVYNLATPYPFSKEDGIRLANVCKLSREIEKENKYKNYFKYYKIITPFYRDRLKKIKSSSNYYMCGGTCGAGIYHIGILPNNYISTCHRAFSGFLEEYVNSVKISPDYMIQSKLLNIKDSQMVFKKENLSQFTDKVESNYYNDSSVILSSLSMLIQMLAICGQIDEKYKNMDEALLGARFIAIESGTCMYDNESETGSLSSTYTGNIKLFLNGAREYILDEYDE